MHISELAAGDILRRWKTGVWHLGIYWGNGKVLHNSPGVGEKLTSFRAFAAGKPVEVSRPDPEMRLVILRRARQIAANPRPYSYLWRNCEHTVYEIVGGAPLSPTIRRIDNVLGGIAVVALAGVAFSFRREIATATRRLVRRSG